MGSKVREAIIKAALELFPSRPYDKVSVEEIASKAGVSKGAVFHYFKSKLDLAREALANFLRGVVTKPVVGIVRSELPVEEKVEKLVELSLRTSRRYNASSLAFMINMYAELEKKGKAHFIREMYRSLIEEISTLFVEISERPRGRAKILAMILDGIAVHYLISPEEFEGNRLRSLIDELRRVMLCRTSGSPSSAP